MRNTSIGTSAALLLALAVSPAYGQFSTVLNIPPDTLSSNFIGSDTQVNVLAGASINRVLTFGQFNGTSSNIELNVFDAGLIFPATLHAGTTVNMSGGNVDEFKFQGGEQLTLSGGVIDAIRIVADTSTVFDVSGGTINDVIFDLPSPTTNPTFNISGGVVNAPNWLGLELFTNRIQAGTLNLTGGTLDMDGKASFLRDASLTGGNVIGSVNATGGAGVLDGATVSFSVGASDGGTMDVISGSAGSVGAGRGGTTNVLADVGLGGLSLNEGGTINFSGGDHQLEQAFFVNSADGTAYLNFNTGTISIGEFLSDVFSDHLIEINIAGGDLTLGDMSNYENPTHLNISSGSLNVQPGAEILPFTRVVMTGGSIGNGITFQRDGSDTADYRFSGGTVGNNVTLSSTRSFDDSMLLFSGTRFGDNLVAELTVRMSGGSVGNNASFQELTLSGGRIGNNATIAGHDFIMTGGALGDDATLVDSYARIYGGQIGERLTFDAFFSEIEIFGTAFTLDGVDITSTLTLGTRLMITDREVWLTGVLDNGTAFDFFLSEDSDNIGVTDYFGENLIYITLTDGPTIGDLDGDGTLSLEDIDAFVLALTDSDGYEQLYPGLTPEVLGDFSGDGLLTNRDIYGFVDALASSSSIPEQELERLRVLAVPEPGSLGLLIGGGLLAGARRRRILRP